MPSPKWLCLVFDAEVFVRQLRDWLKVYFYIVLVGAGAPLFSYAYVMGVGWLLLMSAFVFLVGCAVVYRVVYSPRDALERLRAHISEEDGAMSSDKGEVPSLVLFVDSVWYAPAVRVVHGKGVERVGVFLDGQPLWMMKSVLNREFYAVDHSDEFSRVDKIRESFSLSNWVWGAAFFMFLVYCVGAAWFSLALAGGWVFGSYLAIAMLGMSVILSLGFFNYGLNVELIGEERVRVTGKHILSSEVIECDVGELEVCHRQLEYGYGVYSFIVFRHRDDVVVYTQSGELYFKELPISLVEL